MATDVERPFGLHASHLANVARSHFFNAIEGPLFAISTRRLKAIEGPVLTQSACERGESVHVAADTMDAEEGSLVAFGLDRHHQRGIWAEVLGSQDVCHPGDSVRLNHTRQRYLSTEELLDLRQQ